VTDERRNAERIHLLGTVHGDVLIVQATEIRQISLGGMLVETRFPLTVESLHDFRLMLGDPSVVVKGRVAHSRISDVVHDAVFYQSGVEFVEPSAVVTAAIARFIESLKNEREGL
jgi:acyl-coenzyme A thioesterase PaaI-like protein